MITLQNRIVANLIQNAPSDVYTQAQNFISTLKPDGSWADISMYNNNKQHNITHNNITIQQP